MKDFKISRRGLLIGKALVAVQMAFCLLLLVVAGLFTRSLRVLTQTDIERCLVGNHATAATESAEVLVCHFLPSLREGLFGEPFAAQCGHAARLNQGRSQGVQSPAGWGNPALFVS